MASPVEVLNQPRTDYGSTTRESTQRNKNSQKEDNLNHNRFSSKSLRHISRSDTKFPYTPGMEIENISTNYNGHCFLKIEYAVCTLNRIFIGFVTIYMSWLCLRLGLSGTALHAWLVTVGFSFLMTEGIMCHYSGYSYKRTTKTTIHSILQSVGGSLGVIGILLKCFQKGLLLQSIHAKLGFAALIICLVNMMSGLLTLYAASLKIYINPLLNKLVHNVLGIATLTLALLAQIYGYKTSFFMRKTEVEFQTLLQYITLIYLVLTCLGPVKALFNKLRQF